MSFAAASSPAEPSGDVSPTPDGPAGSVVAAPAARGKMWMRMRSSMLAALVWTCVALGWSWFLVDRSYRQFTEESLVLRAQQIAALVQVETPADDRAQAVLDQVVRLDPQLAYAMVWTEDGHVLLHSDRGMRDTFLDGGKWPALNSGQQSRVANLVLPAGAATPIREVTEATVPVAAGRSPATFVSLAYPRGWLEGQFWRSGGGGGLVAVSVVATAAGMGLVLLAVHLAFARFEQARREIEQTARARTSLLTERGMLASVLAHEVRSPLTALRFNLHALRTLLGTVAGGGVNGGGSGGGAEGDAERRMELTDRCEREIRRLDSMLNDFLLRTQVVGQPEAASLNTVVREAMEFLAPAFERLHIHASLHLDATDPAVHVHPDELRQVILNLAANAQDAMPEGGTLAVSTLAEAPDPEKGPTVTLLMRDSGEGIPAELHERIFEPFFSTKPKGSGLGLTLVRRVVSGAGGTVFCESEVGEGTTFRIVLPAQGTVPAGEGYGRQGV